jgi:hypothetical protein
MVPPFTLIEFIASQSSSVLRANNVKSGTGVAEVATSFTKLESSAFRR